MLQDKFDKAFSAFSYETDIDCDLPEIEDSLKTLIKNIIKLKDENSILKERLEHLETYLQEDLCLSSEEFYNLCYWYEEN